MGPVGKNLYAEFATRDAERHQGDAAACIAASVVDDLVSTLAPTSTGSSPGGTGGLDSDR